MGASNLWLGDMNDGGVSTMRATRDRDDRQSDCTSPSFRRRKNYGKNQEALEERLEDGQCHHGHSSQDGGLIHIKFKSTSDSRSGPH
uniref:Uncharacterized protein n=1 Tax=Oryza glaberrima TaxID=4538 RepID=I1P6H4_ORYGL